MKELNVKLENCYWIKGLDYNFDFEKSNVYSIYAPNGTMKTSFLKWFKDYVSPELINPSDKINNIEWYIILKDENGNIIDKKNIFPIDSLNLEYNWDFSDLLINPKYKNDFDSIYIWIEDQKNKLIRWLNKISWVAQSWMENIIMNDYWYNSWSFYEFLKCWLIDFSNLNNYEKVKYSIIFNDKASDLLNNPNISKNIKDYKIEYERVLKQYSCFNIWGFTIYKADSLLSEMRKTSYFKWTNNKINLNKSDNPEIKSEDEFKDFIDGVKSEISNNKKLEQILNIISKWTAPVKDFQDHLDNEGSKFIMKLDTPSELKKDLWNYYLKQNEEELVKLITLYDSWIKKLNEILEDAEKYESEWHDTIKIFEDRFYIDFKIDIDSKKDVVVWRKTANLKFIYNHLDEDKKVIHNKESLLWLKILSWWEQRVLYLLYIIFEIQLRKKNWWEHLLIIDDIADSFDYKNKYAIIEYLQEISELPWFNIIILTHNFDFYRNIQSRLNIKNWIKWDSIWQWANLSVLKKLDWNLTLIKASRYFNPIEDFKNTCHKCDYKLISLVPVARNIIEYSKWKTHSYYNDLTSIMHLKDKNIKLEDLYNIYSDVFNRTDLDNDKSNDVLDLIIKLSDNLIFPWNDTETLELEKKIVISIWIRIVWEIFMIDKLKTIPNWIKFEENWVEVELSWEDYWKSINKDQTRALYNKIKELNLFEVRNEWEENEINEEKIIKKILLMTPESIHINSFMYEPILDMWDWHLRKLYKEVKML